MLSFFHAVAHKLPQGVKTEFFHCLENGKNKVMPKDGKEFQEMLELVLYDSSKFTFHDRMRQALVEAQRPNYPNFSKSESASSISTPHVTECLRAVCHDSNSIIVDP